jgi:hypothetical protein
MHLKIQLNFGISYTNIMNTMDMSKWIGGPKHLFFLKIISLDISQILWNSNFLLSPIKFEIIVWLYTHVLYLIQDWVANDFWSINVCLTH